MVVNVVYYLSLDSLDLIISFYLMQSGLQHFSKEEMSWLKEIQKDVALVVVILEHKDTLVRASAGRGCLRVLPYNGWPTLLLDVSSGQLFLRPQWPQSLSVITEVKNPLKGCSQCGKAQPECPPAHSCFLLD